MSLAFVDPISAAADVTFPITDWECPQTPPPPHPPSPPSLPVCEQVTIRQPPSLAELEQEAEAWLRVLEQRARERREESRRRFAAGLCCSGLEPPAPAKCRFHMEKMAWKQKKKEAARRSPSPPTVSTKFSAPAPAPSPKEDEDKDLAIRESQKEWDAPDFVWPESD